MTEFINSTKAKSASLSKLLLVKICNSTVLGLVDSGNSFYNAMSLAVATRIGLTYCQPYEGPPVGTAMDGSTLDIVEVIKSTSFTLTDESGKRHVFPSRLAIVRHLSCGLNLSLPILVENGLDQPHSQGVLPWTRKQLQFPLYWNMAHACKLLPKPPASMPINNIIALRDSTIDVSNKNRQVVPTHTGKLINATIDGKAIFKNQTDTVFSYKTSFFIKTNQLSLNKEHPSQNENFFGLNSLDQATLVNPSKDVDVYFFNETNTPITISSNCVIGFINIPESHADVVDMNNVMTIAADSGPETTWLNNIPYAELPCSAHAHRREYVYQVLDVPSSPSLSENPDITGQLVDLIMIFWIVFYRECNCGGTDVMEHPVYTPKGLPPIR